MVNPQQDGIEFGMPWLDGAFGWIERNARRIVIAGILFQFALLGTMIVTNLMPHITGKTILVRVVPVDPRDLFRGEYVILGYDFSRVPENMPSLFDDDSKTKQTVFVTLVPDTDGKHWKAGTFSIERPRSGLYLEGKMSGRRRAEYGIESFYVQEGKGKMYEGAVRNRKLSAEISVDTTGKAALKKLVIE